jgi:hypothetical protein
MADFEIKHGTWESKDGKLIKYTKESCRLNSYDDWNEYHLQITRWPQTTSIEIVVISGDEGYDSESRWSHSEIYRLTKLPHAEFNAQRDALIQKIFRLANEEFGYLTL